MLFGLLMLFSVVRFVALGWVDELLVAPQFHFTYFGFEWVRPWPRGLMLAHFAALGLAASFIALGLFTRVAAAVFFVLWSYAELIDVATYLNHYYLVSLLSLLLVFVPSGAAFSLDAWRAGRTASVRASSYWLLRAQVAAVYVFAGLAKLDGDWLLRAEPLRTWLRSRVESPLLLPLAHEPWVAYAMSWAGAAFDLAIVPLLLYRRTRPFALFLALSFHGAIWLLFPVGVFSFVMLVAITILFDPSWPRRVAAKLQRLMPGAPALLRRIAAPERAFAPGPPLSTLGLGLGAAYLIVQLVMPLRHLLYPGAANWTEQGFRFAWRVMLVEKAGQLEYRVHTGEPERRFHVLPRAELTPLQLRMVATQPDLIQAFAHHLASRYRAEGYRQVRVYADAWVSFNGRRSQRLVDPRVDLAAEPRSLAAKSWILPLEPTPRRQASNDQVGPGPHR